MKQKRPVLYELLREQAADAAASMDGESTDVEATEYVSTPTEEELPNALAWMTPGRVLRVPVGYIFIVAAVILGVSLMAYVAGFTKGSDDPGSFGQGDLPPTMLENHEIASDLSRQQADAQRDERDADSSFVSTSNDRSSRQAADRSRMGDLDANPRQVGLNYYYIVHTNRSGAVAVAEFCRQEGLEAHLSGGNNAKLFGVYVLPGYSREEANSEKVRNLQTKLDQVMKKWNKKVGRKDLARSAQKYKG